MLNFWFNTMLLVSALIWLQKLSWIRTKPTWRKFSCWRRNKTWYTQMYQSLALKMTTVHDFFFKKGTSTFNSNIFNFNKHFTYFVLAFWYYYQNIEYCNFVTFPQNDYSWYYKIHTLVFFFSLFIYFFFYFLKNFA